MPSHECHEKKLRQIESVLPAPHIDWGNSQRWRSIFSCALRWHSLCHPLRKTHGLRESKAKASNRRSPPRWTDLNGLFLWWWKATADVPLKYTHSHKKHIKMQTWEKRPDRPKLYQFTNHCFFLATFLCERSKSFHILCLASAYYLHLQNCMQ